MIKKWFSLLLILVLSACSSSNDPIKDSGRPLDMTAPPSDSGVDTSADSSVQPSPSPVYGIFQLYGDEYQDFLQKMGFSLEDYWGFVDEHVAELDVRFTRTNTLLIWGLVEPEIGAGYDWENDRHTDRVVEATYQPAPGKEMDFLLVLSPGRGTRTDPPYPTGLEQQYGDFVRAAVERYDGDGDEISPHVAVKHWQVMNEPILSFKNGIMSFEEYAELVKITAAAVRAADPTAKVVLGDVGEQFPKILPLLKDGAHFDAVDMHFWCTNTPCAYENPNLAKVRQLLDASGYQQAEIWMTEFGTWVNSAEGLPLHTAEDQARWLVKAMIANRAAGVRLILWNNLVPWTRFGGDPNNVYNFMSLLSNGPASGDAVGDVGRRRVSYHAYRRLIAETDNRTTQLVGELPLSTSGVRAFNFSRLADDAQRIIIWSDDGAKTIQLPCDGASVQLTNLIPSAAGDFQQSPLPCVDSKLTLEVSDDPLLVAAP